MTKKKLLLLIFLILTSVIVFNVFNNNSGRSIESEKAKTVNTTKTEQTIEYNRIKAGSFLNWRASHLGGTGTRLGKIYCKEATAFVTNEKLTNLNALIDMSSLTVENLDKTDANELTEHLKNEDFFNVTIYPVSKFELTDLKQIKGEHNSELTGNLTILGITKSITFSATISVSENEISITSEDFMINRSDWNMTYNAKGTAGVPLNYLISDDIGFSIAITVLK